MSFPDLRDSLFFNRELSWLEFNSRVLSLAEDRTIPLLERVKFIGIAGSNLDEFFMKRVGRLRREVSRGHERLSPDGLTPQQQLALIRPAVRKFYERHRQVFLQELLPALAQEGIELVRYRELASEDLDFVRDFFKKSVFPILTPLGLDPSHPFPFISNLSLSLGVAVQQPRSAEVRFARVKVPQSLQRWVPLPDGKRFVPLEEVISGELHRLFPGREVLEAFEFRVTRAAEVDASEEQPEDLLESVQSELRERRFASVVRLEVVPEMPSWMRSVLVHELEMDPEDVYEVRRPLALRDLAQLVALPRPELREVPWKPVIPVRLQAAPEGRDPDLFQVISEGDLLVHHPYESFRFSVQRFLELAARDPSVLAIKQTLYRTSRDSPVVKALIEAAERGKQVAVVIELKASFDEARNIEWAEALEGAGAHVAYGILGYKTHAKVTMVVRQEDSGIKIYSHVATGNYNTDTAELYTDLGLFTCDPVIGTDVAKLFNALTAGYLGSVAFDALLVAPVNMRQGLVERIEREIAHRAAGKPARIRAKMNGLEDAELVRALYRASQAGVDIELLVRGVCCLRPGVPGLSERIRVRSILGRFLEHARIFVFENAGQPEFWIGSADWMVRNLDGRVEAMVGVRDPNLTQELERVLQFQWEDNCNAWDLQPDGRWVRAAPEPGEAPRPSQKRQMEWALAQAARGTLRDPVEPGRSAERAPYGEELRERAMRG